MNRAFLLILFLFAISVSLHAEVETNDSVDYDRIMREMLEEDYIKASLLVASSGDAQTAFSRSENCK